MNNRSPEPVKIPVATLNAVDRCDSCGAQAYVSAQLVGHQPLLFCAHHYAQYAAQLASYPDVVVIDERWQLAATEVDRKRTGVSA